MNQINSIPHATDRKTHNLITFESDYIAVTVEHVPAPRLIGIVLSSTPPVTAVANIAERAIKVTAATRKGCKAGFVGCPGVGANPMGGTCFF